MLDKKHLKDTALGGILQNPIFVIVLGICPTVGVSSNIMDALMMGLATAFVLIFSNALISLFRKIVPDQIRLPAYIIIIATLVTVVQLFMDKFFHELFQPISSFVSLIVVNCIVLGRAEAYASKHGILMSMLDGVSMGLGFTVSITLLGAVRQFLIEVMKMQVFAKPAGGFIALALLMALFNLIFWVVSRRIEIKKRKIEITSREAA